MTVTDACHSGRSTAGGGDNHNSTASQPQAAPVSIEFVMVMLLLCCPKFTGSPAGAAGRNLKVLYLPYVSRCRMPVVPSWADAGTQKRRPMTALITPDDPLKR